MIGRAVAAGLAVLLGGCGQDGAATSGAGGNVKAALACELTFGVTNATTLRVVEASVRISPDEGRFASDGERAECDNLFPYGTTSATLACADADCTARSGNAIVFAYDGGSSPAVTGPRDLLRCRLLADAEPAPQAFAVDVVDAVGEGLRPPRPWPKVSVTDVRCRADGGSSTTSSTSTTVPACDQAACANGEHCWRGGCVPDGRYEVVFSLDNDVTFGALGIEVDYACRLGAIVGEGVTTACVGRRGLRMATSFNDRATDESPCAPPTGPYDPLWGQLGAGLISIEGVTGPTVLFTCQFQAVAGAPWPSDFSIRLVDHAAPDLRPLDPAPVVTVSEVRSTEE